MTQKRETKAPAKSKYQIAKERRDRAKDGRKRTKAFDGQRLYAKDEPGMYRRWVNDEAGRIDSLQDKGYSFVEYDGDPSLMTEDGGGHVRRRVGETKNGSPLYAYLMELPQEFRDEEDKAREAKIRKTEDSARYGGHGGSGLPGNRMYDPQRGGDNQFVIRNNNG